MGGCRFDRKFGASFLRELPTGPGVYLFKDEAGRVLYAGKARNLRRRLQAYRRAGRRKAQRKMRTLVREAHALEVRPQPSERDALLLENELIRSLRPPFNVDGAFWFLYPAIGLGRRDHQTLLAFTTRPEAWQALGLAWYGSFRSRLRALEAFEAWAALLATVGHLEPASRRPRVPRARGARLVALRQVPAALHEASHDFLAGRSRELLPALCTRLLEKPDARRQAPVVEEQLRTLDAFYRGDVARLRRAQEAAGRAPGFVPAAERDALFLATRATPAPRPDPAGR